MLPFGGILNLTKRDIEKYIVLMLTKSHFINEKLLRYTIKWLLLHANENTPSSHNTRNYILEFNLSQTTMGFVRIISDGIWLKNSVLLLKFDKFLLG